MRLQTCTCRITLYLATCANKDQSLREWFDIKYWRSSARWSFKGSCCRLSAHDRPTKVLLASHNVPGERPGASYVITRFTHLTIPLKPSRCVQALTGDSSTARMNGRQTLHPMQFAEEVLGFEDHRGQSRNPSSTDRDDSLASTSLFRGG